MKITSVLLISMTSFLMIACSKAESKKADPQASGQSNNPTVATFQYYKGGFMAPMGSPNWSHDMMITFTTSGFSIEAKIPNSVCEKKDDFTEAQTKTLFDLVAALNVRAKTPTDPRTADAGLEYIELILSDGAVRRYHLMDEEVPVGELYAVNPDTLSNHLKDLVANLPTVCP